jgi:hypothetical protein
VNGEVDDAQECLDQASGIAMFSPLSFTIYLL